MNLQLITDYKGIPEYRHSFNRLAAKVFGIDFERWYRLGFWNERYVCYSLIDENQVVANVSASRLDLFWQGRRFPAVQIGTVMTDPEFRNRGLALKLMNEVLEVVEGSCDLVYLFGNATVRDFYPKFGFVPVTESRFWVDIPPHAATGKPSRVRRLELANPEDLELLKRLLEARTPFSRILDVDHAQMILAWHCIYGFADSLYYWSEQDLLAIAKVKGDTLNLYDIVGPRRSELLPLINVLNPAGVRRVQFHFTPDFEEVGAQSQPYGCEDSTFFVKATTLQLEGEFCYPYTARA